MPPAPGRETDCPGSLNAVAPGNLVYINDDLSKRRFLVDTGAAFSIFPHHSSASSSGPRLFNANGLPIKCWGEQPMTLSFGGRRFAWTFLLADVQFPIIGVDFLRHHRLLVDPAHNKLVHTASSQSFATVAAVGSPASPSPSSTPSSSPSAAAALPPSSSRWCRDF